MTVIRAANTGVSGIVDPLGRVIARTDPFVETYVAGQIQRARAMPLAAHIGGMAGPVALGQLLLLLLLPVRLQRSIPTQVRLAPARLELPGVLPSVRRRVPRRVHQGVTAPLL
jgi:hypothetical protein